MMSKSNNFDLNLILADLPKFYSHENNISYGIPTTISKIVHDPSSSKDMKGPVQIESDKCYSLMILCLKINCINLRTK